MATQNIEITQKDWQDIITVGSLSLTDSQTYTVAIRGNNNNEIAIAAAEPADGFMGHPVGEDVNFNFTYKSGDKIWVKCLPLQAGKAIVVLS